jgi:carbamoyl-phosphate synthase large subunit
MNRFQVRALVRLLLTVVFGFVAFDLLENWYRRAETSAISDGMTAIGIQGVNHVYGTHILVAPPHNAPFFASVSASCSALGATVAFTAIALFLLHGSIARRALAVVAAVALVMVMNFIRIGLSLAVGLWSGSQAMVTFHDWIGTIIGLAAVLGGFTVFVFMLLPSNRRLLAVARGS